MVFETVVFDFDGTLVDSNQLKLDAFYGLFEDIPSVRQAIGRVLATHREAPRGDIIRNILSQCGQTDNIESRVEALSRLYGQRVIDGVKKCPEKDGAGEILDKLSGRFTLYVSSGTPHEALIQLIDDRGWVRYFQGVYGYPTRKPDALRDIMARQSINPEQVLVVGDGQSDRSAASQVGTGFVSIDQHRTLLDLSKHLEQYL